MDGKSIRRGQAEQIRDAVRPGLAYLRRLRARMEKVGFPGTDPLFQLVWQAGTDNAYEYWTVRRHRQG